MKVIESNLSLDQELMIECGDQPRESHSFIHRRKSLPESTLRRTFLNRDKTTVESQLFVLGQAVTGGSTLGGIRTCDLRVRNALLYPAELRGRWFGSLSCLTAL